jgi:hypothetical protein
MARATTAYRKSSGCSAALDRFTPRCPGDGPDRAGTLSLGFDRDGPVLPASAQTACASRPQTLGLAGPEVALDRLWFDLPPEDRTRFGGCFSRMVLKAWRGTQATASGTQTTVTEDKP